MASETRRSPGFERRRDEVGTLMSSFNKMLLTIEQQAAEINTFATRLDAAYKELESTNARLKEFSFKDEVTGLYNRRFFSHPARGGGVALPTLQPPGVGGAARPRRLQGRQRRARPRRGRRDAARRGPDPHEALARHQRDLPLRRRRVRGAAGGDLQGGRPAVRRPHPGGASPAIPSRTAGGHRQLRRRQPARGRGRAPPTISSAPPTRRCTRPSARARTRSRRAAVRRRECPDVEHQPETS